MPKHQSISPRLAIGALWHRADTTFDDVVLVDNRDVAIGSMPKLQVHRLGLRHRAVSVLIHDRRNRLLLHQRAAGKYHSAGLWTNTCCSHPRPGEDALDAAIRRLGEEMGISCVLRPLFSMRYRAKVSNRLIENEIVHVFSGCFDGSPSPNPDEVADWRWSPLTKVARDVDRRPERYTAWFQKFRRRYWPVIAECVVEPCARSQHGADLQSQVGDAHACPHPDHP